MFRDTTQQGQACRAILARVDLERLWEPIDEPRPTEGAFEALADGDGALSRGEHLMLRVAWDLWNGSGKATIAECLARLDTGNLLAVGTLITAIADGSRAVDEWLAIQEREG